MIRGQGWKYIRYSQGDEYLYHLAIDPGETRNLSRDPKYASQRKRLSSELQAWLRRTGWPG
jgi:arylsulfatase A-like enzyme